MKSHCQCVGLPVDVSMNCTDRPIVGEAGLNVKEAASAAVTVSVLVVLLDPEVLVTVRVTVFDPAAAYAWLGFREVLVPPSPKLHCHELALPVDVSINCTDCPAAGDAGL